MSKYNLVLGARFGKWTVLEELQARGKHRVVKCKCDCGNIREVLLESLYNSTSTRCRNCAAKERAATHKCSKTRLYTCWSHMKNRAGKEQYYEHVTVCDEWKDFVKFKEWAESNGYNDSLTIDRIDPTKGYSPDNCRWATYKEQNEHLTKRSNVTSTYRGVCWYKRYNKWEATITINYKCIHLGKFDNEIDAAKAYNDYVITHNLNRPLNKI